MSRYLLCLGYVLGLMMTGISGDFWGFPIGAIALLILGIGTACGVPRYWRTGPRAVLWLSAGIVGCLAVFYFHMRMPQPTPTDVSRLVSSEVTREFSNEFEIQGQIEQPPQITQSGRIQFVLRADQARVIDPITERAERVHAFHPVTGKLYVTVPQQQGEALYPGQSIGIVGKMYHPQPALNPGGFDFQAYLYRDGIFSGLYGHEIHKIREDQPSFLSTAWLQRQTWRVKQRILSAQVQGLGNPRGLLTTAMAIGKQGIGVPADLRQQFTQAGLAHTLAASGFHVSLLLGIMLRLTQRYSSNLRLAIGVTTLMGYVSLTGIQPSVLRAGIMGIAALVALTTERKVRPLGSLLMAGTLLLLVEPRWIWDLGFQFSFLATLGLLVTAPTLTRWLDWLPPTIASAIAIPLAAYLWTLPLQLWTFGIVSPYSIMVNVLATPLVTLISLGSMISSVAALIYPPIGSFLASLLLYPTDGLIGITQLTRDLPGSAYALGTLSSWTVWCIYGLFLLIMWQQRWQRHWWIVGGISMSLVVIPVWQTQSQPLKLTVLGTSGAPVMVVQDQGEIGLINAGTEKDAEFSVLPFLRTQGINRIHWAIATHSHLNPGQDPGWQRMISSLPMPTVIHPSLNAPILLNGLSIIAVNIPPAVVQLQVGAQRWLLLNCRADQCQSQSMSPGIPAADVLWWSGAPLSPQLLNATRPTVAIATSRDLQPETQQHLTQRHIKTYLVGQDGAVQWSERQGYVAKLVSTDPSTQPF